MNRDISKILKSWRYQSDTLVIRKIVGDDGRKKVQIRIKLGILQMEVDGRPDGKSPHEAESLLEYYDFLIDEFKKKDGNAENFTLTEKDMEELDDELMQYYHRRICFFALEDYEHAKRDAEHNLRLMNIIKEHSLDERYIESHEQFRPFIIMDKARAIGLKSMNRNDYANAMIYVSGAIDEIEEFFRERDTDEAEIQKNRELIILKKWKNQIYQEWEGNSEGEDDDDEDDYEGIE